MSFRLRPAIANDISDVYRLSQLLNTLNLPHDRPALETLLACSEKSFAGKIKNKSKAIYVFALEDLALKRVVGVRRNLSCRYFRVMECI